MKFFILFYDSFVIYIIASVIKFNFTKSDINSPTFNNILENKIKYKYKNI